MKMNKQAAPEPIVENGVGTAQPPAKKTGRAKKSMRRLGSGIEKGEAYLYTLFDVDDDMPLSKHVLLFAIAGFFTCFILWANLATLDEVTKGEGKIIPSSDVQALQSLDAGIINEFLVKEGQEVKTGQVLIRLSDVEASSDLGANRAKYLGLLAATTRLQAEAEGKPSVVFPDEVMKGAPASVAEEMNAFRANQQQIQSQLNILTQQLAQREQEVRELETKISDTRGVINLQMQEKDMISPLVSRGSAPKLELLQLDRTIKEKSTELNSYLSSLPRARSAAGEVRARVHDITTAARAQAQTELAAKTIELNEIKERLSALTVRKTRAELKSPVNGTIQEIAIKTVGGVVRPGVDIIKIVPKDDALIVEAKVKPSDRAFIYPGQSATVKLSAYDFSIYGGLKATVVDISADTIEDERHNFFYRVRLSTKDKELKRRGEVLPIIPGMVATVDILTGHKTVMQYLMKPLIKTMRDAMSER